VVSRFPVAVVDEPPRDLPDLLGRLVRRDPAAAAVIDIAEDRRSLMVSRAELWRRVVELADRLRRAGVGAGDCVAVWLPNWSDALCWQFAAAARGAHVIGVNTRYNVDEVTHLLDRAQPRLVAVAHRFHGLDLGAKLAEAADRSGMQTPEVAVVAGPGGAPASPAELAGYDLGAGAWTPTPVTPTPDTPTPVTPIPDAPPAGQRHGEVPPLPESDPTALAVAFTTSGSTGRPKLAAHTGLAVLGHAIADAAAIGLVAGDVLLCGVPLAGTYGFSAAMAALAGGATVLLEPVFDADGVLDDMVHHQVTHLVGGDDFGLRLYRAWCSRPRDLSGWRWWGAANFQGRLTELAEWAADEFGTATSGLYGSSEVFALTAMWPGDEPPPRRWRAGGRVVSPEIQVRVTDPDTGRPREPGQEGELEFVGPNVVDAYLGDPDAAARAFTEDGWFRSGDLGYLVEEGVFGFTCRMGDALRLHGFLVDPAEIELRLAEHPEVDAAKVVGVPGTDGATRAVAFVVPVERRPEPSELREWCAATLAKFKVPDEVYLIDEMPTIASPNGTKIRKATLVEWAAARAAGESPTPR
jgi:acyl-CoA synthetase (AMP-forming)/AMP-acid ligase II